MKYGEVTPLFGITRALRDLCQWLDQCPFEDGTPFFESAERELEPMRKVFRKLYTEEMGTTPERGDPDLFDETDKLFEKNWSETEIWEAMLERIEANEERASE